MEVISTGDPWPFRITLTTDHLRWNSLKISPSEEFKERVLEKMNQSSRQALESWIPVNVSIYDVDTGETYDDVKLSKKEAFWFDPIPDTGGQCSSPLGEPACYDSEEARKEFAYSIEPFRPIARRRGLGYGQEIGLRCCSDTNFQFSVLHSSRFGYSWL